MKQKFVSMPYLMHFLKNLGIVTNYEPYIIHSYYGYYSAIEDLKLVVSFTMVSKEILVCIHTYIYIYMICLNRLENRKEFIY